MILDFQGYGNLTIVMVIVHEDIDIKDIARHKVQGYQTSEMDSLYLENKWGNFRTLHKAKLRNRYLT